MFIDLDCEYQENHNLCRSEFAKNIESFPVMRYYSLGYKDIDTYIEYTLKSDWIDYASEIDEDLTNDEMIKLTGWSEMSDVMRKVYTKARLFAICYYKETLPTSFQVI